MYSLMMWNVLCSVHQKCILCWEEKGQTGMFLNRLWADWYLHFYLTGSVMVTIESRWYSAETQCESVSFNLSHVFFIWCNFYGPDCHFLLDWFSSLHDFYSNSVSLERLQLLSNARHEGLRWFARKTSSSPKERKNFWWNQIESIGAHIWVLIRWCRKKFGCWDNRTKPPN